MGMKVLVCGNGKNDLASILKTYQEQLEEYSSMTIVSPVDILIHKSFARKLTYMQSLNVKGGIVFMNGFDSWLETSKPTT